MTITVPAITAVNDATVGLIVDVMVALLAGTNIATMLLPIGSLDEPVMFTPAATIVILFGSATAMDKEGSRLAVLLLSSVADSVAVVVDDGV